MSENPDTAEFQENKVESLSGDIQDDYDESEEGESSEESSYEYEVLEETVVKESEDSDSDIRHGGRKCSTSFIENTKSDDEEAEEDFLVDNTKQEHASEVNFPPKTPIPSKALGNDSDTPRMDDEYRLPARRQRPLKRLSLPVGSSSDNLELEEDDDLALDDSSSILPMLDRTPLHKIDSPQPISKSTSDPLERADTLENVSNSSKLTPRSSLRNLVASSSQSERRPIMTLLAPPSSVTPAAVDGTPTAVDGSVIAIQTFWRMASVRRISKPIFTRNKKRTKIVKEILQTEEDYVENMNILLSVYLRPLKTSLHDISNIIGEQLAQQVPALTSDIEVICKFHSVFLGDIRKRLENWNNATTNIADLFISMAAYLKAYAQYVNHYQTTVPILAQSKENKPLQQLLESLKIDKAHGKGIKDFLIMPVQRIPRYNLLLNDLLKNTPKDHVDYTDLVTAAKRVVHIANEIESLSASFESINHLLQIASSLQFPSKINVKIVEPHRRVVDILETNALLPGLPERSYKLYIFNDMIILAKKSGRVKVALGYDSGMRVTRDPQRDGRSSFCIHTVEKEQIFVWMESKQARDDTLLKIQKAIMERIAIQSEKSGKVISVVSDDIGISMTPSKKKREKEKKKKKRYSTMNGTAPTSAVDLTPSRPLRIKDEKSEAYARSSSLPVDKLLPPPVFLREESSSSSLSSVGTTSNSSSSTSVRRKKGSHIEPITGEDRRINPLYGKTMRSQTTVSHGAEKDHLNLRQPFPTSVPTLLHPSPSAIFPAPDTSESYAAIQRSSSVESPMLRATSFEEDEVDDIEKLARIKKTRAARDGSPVRKSSVNRRSAIVVTPVDAGDEPK